MALPHAQSGDVVDVRPLGPALAGAGTTTLVNTDTLEVMRLVIPEGKDIPQHWLSGETLAQCLEGEVACTVNNTTSELKAGDMMYLSGGVSHSFHGIRNASVLLTILVQDESGRNRPKGGLGIRT